MRLNLTLGVADIDRTALFYREILKLNPLKKDGAETEAGFLLLELDQIKIVFQPIRQMERQHPALLQNLTRSHLGTGVQLELSCPDLEPIYLNVERYQWPVAYELEDQQHQRRELWLQDPDGYLLVLNEEQSPDYQA